MYNFTYRYTHKLLGMMVHACTPSTQEAEAKDQELEVSLGYIIARLSQKNIYLYMCVNIL